MVALQKLFQNANDVDFADLFRNHVMAGQKTAEQLGLLLAKVPGDVSQILDQIAQLEHEGDSIVAGVHVLLDEAFIIKRFDKEDIARLTSQLDDIIDDMRDAARYIESYGVREVEPAAFKLVQTIVRMIVGLSLLTNDLLKLTPAKVSPLLEGLKEYEREADQLRAQVMRGLVTKLKESPTAEKQVVALYLFTAWKDIAAKLERVTDHCAHAGNTIASMVRKF